MKADILETQSVTKSYTKEVSKPQPVLDYSLPLKELKKVMPPLITVRQAAAMGIACDRKIRKMCAEGTIPSVKVGSDWRIRRDEFFEQFLSVY